MFSQKTLRKNSLLSKFTAIKNKNEENNTLNNDLIVNESTNETN